MNDCWEEVRTLRNRVEAAERLLANLPDPTPARPTFLAQTTTVTTYPTTAAATYAVKRATASGDETEGAAVTISVAASIFYAANVGSAIPPSGTKVLVTLSDGGKYTFRYDG